MHCICTSVYCALARSSHVTGDPASSQLRYYFSREDVELEFGTNGLLIGGRVNVHVALISASSSVPPSNNPNSSPATRLPPWGLANTLSHVEATDLIPPTNATISTRRICLPHPSPTSSSSCTCYMHGWVLYHDGRHTSNMPYSSSLLPHELLGCIPGPRTHGNAAVSSLPAIGDGCLESRASGVG